LIVVNGWTVLAHNLFLDQVESLAKAVEKSKGKDPQRYGSTANAKTLAAIIRLIGQDIPSNPSSKHFRQGDTLGPARRHWFRAKFGNGRFRLFFRFDTRSKTIVCAWVNDEETKRTYGSSTDAYKVFKGMLDAGNPPDDWHEIYKACTTPQAKARLAAFVKAAVDQR
jgi:toxin YhaV